MSSFLKGRPIACALVVAALLFSLFPSHAIAAGGEITLTLRERGTNEPIDYPAFGFGIELFRWPGASTDRVEWAQPDALGRVTFSDLPADEYIVALGRQGFVHEYASAAAQLEDARRFTVSDTSTVDIGTLYMTPAHSRAGGDDRYGTAVAASRLHFDPGTDAVVIASGEDFPDGLAASGLAGAVRAPLLLSRSTSMDEVVLAEIDRLGAKTVYIVGGTAAVGAGVESAVRSRPSVEQIVRISGQDRYATAAAVARAVHLLVGDDFPKQAFLVRGDTFPDAVSVSPYAFSRHIPVLLARPRSLAAASAQVIVDLEVSEVFIAGGTSAVSDGVAGAVGSLGEGVAVRRLMGSDRYGTAFRVADYAIERGWAGDTIDKELYTDPRLYVAFATGENFPDALAGGPVCGIRDGVLLLTRPTGYRNDEERSFVSKYGAYAPFTETPGLGSVGREAFIIMGQQDVVPAQATNRFWLTRNEVWDNTYWYICRPTPASAAPLP